VCCDFVGASLMMALVVWSDNFGCIMVLFFLIKCVDVDDAINGAKLENNRN